MERLSTRVVLLALCGLLLAAVSLALDELPGPTGSIAVTLEGVDAGQGGVLLLFLYRGEEGWLEEEAAVAIKTVAVSAATATVLFEAVPFGRDYALQVFHDANGNGEMDFRWFPYPKPKEGAGVSNNNVRMGPPKFDEARFKVTGPLEPLRITLRY